MKTHLDLDLIREATGYLQPEEAALGYLRYEALRKLTAQQYMELWLRNIRGENFDDMIDQMVLEHITK